MNQQQTIKRKAMNDFDNNSAVKKLHKSDNAKEEDIVMEEEHTLPPRPTTPPLGMTLSHYDPSTGSYTPSQFNSHHEVKSSICTGMTPVYRAPFERWGSCLI